MSEKMNYTVKADGWVAGTYCKEGTPIEMTEAEAKYETNLQPVVTGIDLANGTDETVVAPVTKPKANKRSRKSK